LTVSCLRRWPARRPCGRPYAADPPGVHAAGPPRPEAGWRCTSARA